MVVSDNFILKLCDFNANVHLIIYLYIIVKLKAVFEVLMVLFDSLEVYFLRWAVLTLVVFFELSNCLGVVS